MALSSWRVESGLLRGLCAAALAVLLSCVALARDDDGRWNNVDPSLRRWFSTLMQPDRSDDASCCDDADTYFADEYRLDHPSGGVFATITDNRGNSIAVGSQIFVPLAKVNRVPNRTSHTLIFLGGTAAKPVVFCFLPASGV